MAVVMTIPEQQTADQQAGTQGRLPRFSIIIPTYRRPEHLRRCLAAISDLDYPRDRFEVIVVDDGGDQPLDEIVKGTRETLNIDLLCQKNAGPGAARNAGAAQANGEYLLFTDDDCRPQADWLRAYAEAIARHPRALLGGDTANGLTGNPWSEGSQAVQTWLYDYFERYAVEWRFLASNNLCVPTRAFLAQGGFDTETIVFASEDREFSERWRHAGGTLHHVPGARITHEHALGPTSLLHLHFRYGRGACRLQLARARKGMPTPPGDRRWAVLLLTRYPWSEPGLGRKLKLGIVAWASFAATVIGFYYEKFVN